MPGGEWKNQLYYGDNLDVLRRHIGDETVDLVYLDPPFNSNATYNVLFAEQDGSQAASQIKAFGDTWKWDQEAARQYEEMVEAGGQVSRALQAFRALIGESNMLAYLAMMTPRLIELRRVLKPTGSIYLHCDPTASHYLKLLMDAVFGVSQFRNEIIWAYRGGGAPRSDFGRRHDVILRYSKTDGYLFYPDAVRIPYQAEGIGRTDDAMWGKHRGANKVYKPHPLGKIPEDWWPMNILNANDPERLGYPTQKPEALLERIINASSNKGDVVLDPFCGCGTTIAVAEHLKRRWIGIDITHLAITLMKHRLHDAFGDALAYDVVGEPVSIPDAEALAASDPYQFQWWALGLVGARPVEQKKGADQGIDGRLYFHDEAKGKTKQIILSVKAGGTGVAHIRDLRGVIEREQAEIGVLITMQEPTAPMKKEAASAGFYTSRGWRETKHPRIQLLTVEELLDGRGIDCPERTANASFKKAPRAEEKVAEDRLL
ncbi:MAG TPA: DNA methyltransferase [Thermoplasmata archaeon]|nr:DNA methyltransferase [Thermoplasmata archaeon]